MMSEPEITVWLTAFATEMQYSQKLIQARRIANMAVLALRQTFDNGYVLCSDLEAYEVDTELTKHIKEE